MNEKVVAPLPPIVPPEQAQQEGYSEWNHVLPKNTKHRPNNKNTGKNGRNFQNQEHRINRQPEQNRTGLKQTGKQTETGQSSVISQPPILNAPTTIVTEFAANGKKQGNGQVNNGNKLVKTGGAKFEEATTPALNGSYKISSNTPSNSRGKIDEVKLGDKGKVLIMVEDYLHTNKVFTQAKISTAQAPAEQDPSFSASTSVIGPNSVDQAQHVNNQGMQVHEVRIPKSLLTDLVRVGFSPQVQIDSSLDLSRDRHKKGMEHSDSDSDSEGMQSTKDVDTPNEVDDAIRSRSIRRNRSPNKRFRRSKSLLESSTSIDRSSQDHFVSTPPFPETRDARNHENTHLRQILRELRSRGLQDRTVVQDRQVMES